MSPWAPTFEPLFAVLGAVAAWLYVRAWRQARPQPPAWRAWLFGLGGGLIVVALNSPLETIAVEYLLLFHLLQNVAISDWAPLLLLLGLTPAMRAGVAASLGGWFAWITRPAIALGGWLAGWERVPLAGRLDARPARVRVRRLRRLRLSGARAHVLAARVRLLRESAAAPVGHLRRG